ncbi:MAG: adenylate/guanylate cyclase domain-containing protein, partial [Dehalococcoidia bacterium]
FVAPSLAEALSEGGEDLLRSHRREVAVVFTDLRGWTPFSETGEPEDVMTVLNELHQSVGPLVFEHQGTILQFTGDGLLILLNDPLPCEDPAGRAVHLAMAMQERMRGLGASWRRRGHELDMGVAVAFGYATCGRIGFEGRYEYTAIGTVVNLASRLCAAAKPGQVLVSQRVQALVDDQVEAELAGEMELKGFARAVPVYSVVGERR